MVATTNYDVFISHSTADNATARLLAERLSSLDLRVFLDVDQIEPGDDWRDVISDALDGASAIAVLLSSGTNTTGFASLEISNASEIARTGRSLLIPVYLDEQSARNVPRELEKFQGIRVLDNSELEVAAQKIAKAVADARPVSLAYPATLGKIPERPPEYVSTTTIDKVLQGIESALADGAGPVQIIGPGGTGKTIAVAEACRRLQARLSIIWWNRSGSIDDIVDSLAALGEQLHVEVAETADRYQIAYATVHYLESTATTWCLVFDEADLVEDLSRWVPESTSSGTSLLISRRQLPWVHGGFILHVADLDVEEATQYLKAQLSTVPSQSFADDDLSALAEALGGSPLALTLAAGYLERSYDSPSENLTQLLELVRGSRSAPEAAIDLRSSLEAMTDRFLRETSTPVATDIFLALGCLADAPFPIEAIFLTAEDSYLSSSRDEISKAVESLLSAGLVSVSLGEIDVHMVIRSFARERSGPDALAFLSRSIGRFLDESTDPPRENGPALSAHVRQILSEAHQLDGDHARNDAVQLGLRLARLLAQDRLYEYSAELLEETLAASERILGPDHPSTLTVRANLAGVYQQLGRREEALALLQETLAASERILGPDHPSTLTVRANLAGVYQQLGRREEALALLQETLAASERILGPDHPSTLTVRANLAGVYQQLGRREEALALLQETLAASERILGPDHPSTLTVRANLAGVYQQLGRREEALALLQETLAASERILGPDHPSTLTVRANLAGVYQQLGRREEALALLQETLAASERILGPDHPSTLTVRANLEYVLDRPEGARHG